MLYQPNQTNQFGFAFPFSERARYIAGISLVRFVTRKVGQRTIESFGCAECRFPSVVGIDVHMVECILQIRVPT